MAKRTAVVWPNGKPTSSTPTSTSATTSTQTEPTTATPNPSAPAGPASSQATSTPPSSRPNGKAYFFHADRVHPLRHRRLPADDGYPQTHQHRPLDRRLSQRDIDAAVVPGPTARPTSSTPTEYTRYDIDADRADDGYPQPISTGPWAGVFASDIDAAVVWPQRQGLLLPRRPSTPATTSTQTEPTTATPNPSAPAGPDSPSRRRQARSPSSRNPPQAQVRSRSS